MSQKNIFSLRPKGDEHGVTDLLREVSQRNSSLSDAERKEVSEMIKRVEQHKDLVDQHKVKPSPMALMKKKLAEINVGNDTGVHLFTKSPTTIEEETDKDTTTRTKEPVNKLAKDFFQKFSNMQTIQNPLSSSEENRGKELFKSLSMKGIQNPLKAAFSDQAGSDEDKRPDILKAFEQSSQSGKEMLRNLSKKIQNPLLSPSRKDPQATAAAISESLRVSQEIQSTKNVFVPEQEDNEETTEDVNNDEGDGEDHEQ